MCGSVTKPKESSVIIQTLKTSRTLNDNSQSSFIQKDIRDIIQIDKTTFIIATWSSLSAIRFETDNYLQSPFHIIDLTQHDSYYTPILKNRITDIHFVQIQQCALGRNFRQRITETESQRKRYQPYPVER